MLPVAEASKLAACRRVGREYAWPPPRIAVIRAPDLKSGKRSASEPRSTAPTITQFPSRVSPSLTPHRLSASGF